MLTEYPLLGYPLVSDDGALSGGSWPSFPLANLQSNYLSVPARSATAALADTTMVLDLGNVFQLRVVSLVKHNLSRAAKVRVRASSTIDFGVLAPLAPDISLAPWTSSGTPLVAAVAGPDGEMSAWSVDDNDVGAAEFRALTFPNKGDGVRTFGVWIHKGSGAASVIAVRDTSAPAYRLFATVTWVAGAPGTPAMTTGAYVSQKKGKRPGWYYLEFTTTSLTAANTNQLWLFGATEVAGTTGSTYYARPRIGPRNVVPSTDISGGSWANLQTPGVSVTTGPFGAQDGYVILDNSATDYEGRSISVAYTTDGIKPLNVWIKKGSAAKSTISISDQTASALRLTATVTWIGTTPGTPVCATGTYVSQTASLFFPGWYLLRFLTTAVTAVNDNVLFLVATSLTVTETGSTAYALPWTEDDSVAYEDAYASPWELAWPQIFEGPSNLLAPYQALNGWSIDGTPIVRAGYADPFGGQRAFLVEDDDGTGTEQISHVIPFLFDGTKTAWLYIKRGSLSIADFQIYDSTVVTTRHRVRATFSAAGVPTLSTTGGAGTLGTPTDCGGGWWRISFTANGIISAHANIFVIYPHDGTAATVGSIYIFQPWAEDAAETPASILDPGEPAYIDGRPTQAMLDAGYDDPFIHVAPSRFSAQFVRLDIDDTANPDTYVQAGRLAVAPGYNPSRGWKAGQQISLDTETVKQSTDGGARVYTVRPIRRGFTGALMLPENELLQRVMDMQRSLGTGEQFMFVRKENAGVNLARTSFLATLERMTASTWDYNLPQGDIPVIVSEVL